MLEGFLRFLEKLDKSSNSVIRMARSRIPGKEMRCASLYSVRSLLSAKDDLKYRSVKDKNLHLCGSFLNRRIFPKQFSVSRAFLKGSHGIVGYMEVSGYPQSPLIPDSYDEEPREYFKKRAARF